MVSPQNTASSSVSPGVLPSDRGFVTEESVITTPAVTDITALPRLGYSYPVYFWGSVIAGTVLVMSLFVLSYLLMLGCHVGTVGPDGALSFGWGAAVWLVITSCIAYYFGGMLTNCISRPIGMGWLKGATVWGLSIPLALVISSVLGAGLGVLGLSLAHVENAAGTAAPTHLAMGFIGPDFGAIWTAFLILICGLVFAMFGSASAVPVNTAAISAASRCDDGSMITP